LIKELNNISDFYCYRVKK